MSKKGESEDEATEKESEDRKKRSELAKMKERVGVLETDMGKLREEAEKVLVDVRSELSAMENPINYLRQFGLGELIDSVTDTKLKELETKMGMLVDAKIKKGIAPFVEAQIGERVVSLLGGELEGPVGDKLEELLSGKVEEITDRLREEVRGGLLELRGNPSAWAGVMPLRSVPDAAPSNPVVLNAMASYFLHTFGKEGAARILNTYFERGWMSERLKSSLESVMSVVAKPLELPDEVEAGVKDHTVAAYLIRTLVNGAGGDLAALALLLDKRLGSGEGESSRTQ